MIFMWNVARGKKFVQGFGAGVKAEIVFRTAIKINLHSRKIRGTRYRHGIISSPECGIEWRPKRTAKNTQPAELPRIRCADFGERLKQCRTMRAHGAEELWMAEGDVQRTVSAHRNSCNSARFAPRLRAIPFFDPGHELLQEEILIAVLAIARVDIETRLAGWRHYQEFSQLMLLPKVLDKIHPARMHKHLLVIAQPV